MEQTGSSKDPTRRFSSRVEPYIRYRPGYPSEVLEILESRCGLNQVSVVADVGSGTGILTELFLKNGNLVYGVEPNREMREAAETLLKSYPRFISVTGKAEATTLGSNCISFVTAAQAFHWFDIQKARREFTRILKPQGWVVLVWNILRATGTPFLEAYQQLLLTYSTDYEAVARKQTDGGAIETFFRDGSFKCETLQNHQNFDFEGLNGRLLSSSFVPEASDPQYLPMLAALESIFHVHQVNGTVTFEYDTMLYYGRLG
jgi:SAM-dependent methyltransferase